MGSGLTVQDVGLRVRRSGFRVGAQALGFRV